MMEWRASFASVLITAALLLTGCGSTDTSLKPEEAPSAAAPQPAAEQTAEIGSEGDEAEHAEVLQTELPAETDVTRVRIERVRKDADDPAEGTVRILNYAWDSVRVSSDRYPEAAEAITEQMAVEQDLWYTGTGENECDAYGYSAMLEAAEDSFTAARQNGGEPTACYSTRYVTVLRADAKTCAFLITTSTNIGGVGESSVDRLICFDMETGDVLPAGSAAEADTLRKLADTLFPPKQAEGTAAVKIMPMDSIPEDSMEIVDQIVVGDGGEACLLVFEGQALDVEICTVQFSDRFIPDQQLFFCGELQDCALQLALLFPGDLPNTMLRYRDSEGEHEYLISMSGYDGSIILNENIFTSADE